MNLENFINNLPTQYDNRKIKQAVQNKDMLRFLSCQKAQDEVKRHGAVVVRNGIHTFKQFIEIINK